MNPTHLLSTRLTPFENFKNMIEHNSTITQEFQEGIAALPKPNAVGQGVGVGQGVVNAPQKNPYFGYDFANQKTCGITGIALYVFAGIYAYKGDKGIGLFLALAGTLSIIASRHFYNLWDEKREERLKPAQRFEQYDNEALRNSLNRQLTEDRKFIVGQIEQDLRATSLFSMTVVEYNSNTEGLEEIASLSDLDEKQKAAEKAFTEIRHTLLTQKLINSKDDEKGPGERPEGYRLQYTSKETIRRHNEYRPIVEKLLETTGIDPETTKLRKIGTYFLGRNPPPEGYPSHGHNYYYKAVKNIPSELPVLIPNFDSATFEALNKV